MKLVTIENHQYRYYAFEIPDRAIITVACGSRGFLPARVRTIVEGIDAGKSGQVELSADEIAGIEAVQKKVAGVERQVAMQRGYNGGRW